MTLSLLTSLACAAAPAFTVDPSFDHPEELSAAAEADWVGLGALYAAATGAPLPVPKEPLRIAAEAALPSGWSGKSRLGLVSLRPGSLADPEFERSLRHELAHQALWLACPASSGDALFHEAFAVAVSGELEAWSQGPYLSLAEARSRLRSGRTPGAPRTRAALARLLSEWHPEGDGLPPPLHHRLQRCAAGASWTTPLTAEELDARSAFREGDSLVVLSRHSGEILQLRGDAREAMPYGSTLKPFVLAAAERWPTLSPRADSPEWACGPRLPSRVDGPTALLRSCNGYFLDWGGGTSGSPLGAYGPLLSRLGLGRVPTDIAEAIGLRADLSISPLGLAQAYRFLAETRPDILKLMTANARSGTLAGLPASTQLVGIATKTGTVRDSASRPRVGWIVAVDGDVVLVMTRAATMPRDFAGELAAALQAARAQAGQRAVEVQTFGLVPLAEVRLSCAGVSALATARGPLLPEKRPLSAEELSRQGRALCLGAPWQVTLPGESPREYAGSFNYSAAPKPVGSGRGELARRGSDSVFRTTEARYVAGVLAAEDDGVRGEARTALAEIVASNARQPRHGVRPLCDTTHCQAFRGTRAPRRAELAALAKPPLSGEWLLFSRGGRESWSQPVALDAVETVLGVGWRDLTFGAGHVRYSSTVRGPQGWYDEAHSIGCEALRAPLALPSCPDGAEARGPQLIFHGHGRGHGEGLDVEWADGSGLAADDILRHAYGASILEGR